MIKPPANNHNETLILFRRRVIRLSRTGLARQLRMGGLLVDIYRRADGGFELVLPKVTDDALDAFLLNYRVLTQNNDRLSVYSIANLIHSLPIPSAAKNHFGIMRDTLKEHLEARPLVSLGRCETNQNFINVMLYGLFAHSDPAKYALANTWIADHGEEVIKLSFVTALDGAMRHITRIGAAVGTICRFVRKA